MSTARSALDAKFGKGWFDRLWGTGSFEAISNDEALRMVGKDAKYSKDGKIEAFYNPADDKVYFVPENISKDRDVAQLALHEIGVHMMRLGQNQEEFDAILSDFESKRESNPLVKAAFKSAEKADTKAEHLNEEALAHLIDKHPELKLSQRFIAWFKQAVRDFAKQFKGSDKLRFVQWANKLNEKDWVYMATSALRSAPTNAVFKGDPSGGKDIIKASKLGYKGGSASEAKEWLRAVEKGLDMSFEARMDRAKAMGFDVQQKWYHGTYNKFKEFSATYGYDFGSRSGAVGTISLTQDIGFAENHGSEVLELFLKNKNTFDYRNEQHQYYAYLEFVEQNKKQLKEWGITNEGKAELDAKETLEKLNRGDYRVIEMMLSPKWFMDNGFDSAYMKEHGAFNINIFDPKKARSIDAAFDPDFEDSANLLASKTESKPLLAPNGKPSNLNAMQHAQVRTPEFLNWFGDWINDPENASKVVDENGEPLVVYHGSNAAFSEFKKSYQVRGAIGDGFYFTPHKSLALDYAKYNDENVTHVFLSIRKPMDSWGEQNRGTDGVFMHRYQHEIESKSPPKEIVVFEPNQIKSATGNNGDFSKDNNDIRFSKSTGETEEAPQFDFNVSDTSFFDKVRTKMQDRLLRVLQFQTAIKKQGGIINDLNNVHMAAEIAPNIAASTFKSIESNLIEPLQARMAKLKDIDNKVIFMLMYAKHAPERNAYIQSINKKFKGRDAGSGMSNEYAADLIATYKEKYGDDYAEIESIANDWQKLTTKTRELLKSSGDISPETAQAWDGMFDYYVPLKGFEEIDTDGKTTGNGTGMGFSIANKFSKATLGRESLAGQGVENIVIDLQRAVVRASNIYVQKTLVNLIHDNPNDDKWEVDVKQWQPIMGKTKTQYYLYHLGKEVAVRDTFKDAMRYRNALITELGRNSNIKDFTIEKSGGDPSVTSMAKQFDPREDIAYWENGKKVTIRVHDKSFTDAFNNLEDADVLAAFTTMSAFNRVLRTGYTSFNPTFLIKNMLMVDPIVAGVTLTGRKGFKFAGESLLNIPSAFKSLVKFHKNGTSTDVIDRYRKAGGSMDVLFIGSLEKTADDMDRALNKSAGRIKSPKDILYRVIENKFFDMINILSNAGEQGTRLATFKTAIDSGMSDMQAASLANNVTVNFGRRGSFGREAGAMWLFFNAGMQGTQNLSNVLTEGEHKEKAWGLLGALFVATFFMYLLGDDDDDNEDDDDLTSEYEKQRNLVINIFGVRFLWKMPYQISFAADLGRAAADIVKLANAGKATSHELNKIAGRVASSLFTNFAPGGFNPMPNGTVDVKDAAVSATPTMFKPIIMSATNRNSFGSDLVPDKPFNTTQPDSEKSYRKTKGSGYDKFAKWMNKVTGGDEANEGLIDVSPETLKMGANYLGGGAGKWVTEFASMLTTEGGEMGVDKIPTLNSIVKVTGIDDYRRRYYDQAHEVTQVHERYKAYEASGNKEGMKRLKAESGKLLDLHGEGGTSYQGFKIANKGGLKDKLKEFRELQDSADK